MQAVALTFDVEHPDQPNGDPLAVTTVLRSLRELNAKGTFFIQGAWACAYPDQARSIADDGHLIGLHSHRHAAYTYLNDEGLATDLAKGHQAVKNVTGQDPLPWFRLPFGRGAHEPRIHEKLAESGFRSVYWNVDPRDWDSTGSREAVAKAMIDGVREGSSPRVVVCHAWSRLSAEALPQLSVLVEAGHRFVTVADLGDDVIKQMHRGKVWVRPSASGPFTG